jgi:hypothetical protein
MLHDFRSRSWLRLFAVVEQAGERAFQLTDYARHRIEDGFATTLNVSLLLSSRKRKKIGGR